MQPAPQSVAAPSASDDFRSTPEPVVTTAANPVLAEWLGLVVGMFPQSRSAHLAYTGRQSRSSHASWERDRTAPDDDSHTILSSVEAPHGALTLRLRFDDLPPELAGTTQTLLDWFLCALAVQPPTQVDVAEPGPLAKAAGDGTSMLRQLAAVALIFVAGVVAGWVLTPAPPAVATTTASGPIDGRPEPTAATPFGLELSTELGTAESLSSMTSAPPWLADAGYAPATGRLELAGLAP